MKALKKVASLVIAAAMITSSFAFTASVSAAEIPDAAASAVSSDSAIQSEVKDGVILHAFNWSYNSIKENLPAIAAAGYTTVQTSPVQQAKDYGTSNDVAGQWWKLYQPVSMSIAQKSWLGTKEDLKSLCAEADKYGIKIICDIVSNHMGNEVETDPNSLSEQVNTYQPDFYTNKSTYFHSYTGNASDSSIQSVVQGHVSACPDLNTGNSNVQNAVISLLKECIDCGVDGFRFDAAKHIETPNDGSYASDYWPNITSAAESYYKEKTGGNLYIYGEILNTCGSGRSYSSYTEYINVTDNRTGDAVLAAVSKGNASTAAKASYKSGVSASNAVLWAESHDTFEGESGSAGIANTAGISDEDVIKAWSIVASRKDSTALYFARPGAALMGEAATDTAYKSTAVSEVNKFHNLFVGQSEKLGSSDGVAYVARGTSGIVLANCTGTTKSVSISGTGIADGSYVDTITGNKFTVSGGVLTGSIGDTGVAVVYNGSTTPKNTCSVESSTFKGETMTVELGLENAVSGTYCLDDSTPVTYTGKTTIRIGSDYKYGETINLTLTATDGAKTTTTTYKYTKQEAASSGVYIFFDTTKFSTWTSPFNVYIYDEDTSSTETYSNASWPGQPMQLDPATGYYYVEVSDKSCLAKDNASQEITNSTFDLAHSSNTYVIISDSAGHQHPSDGARTKRSLGGSSKILTSTAKSGWASTDLVPSAGTPVEATEVTKGTVATVPTTTAPVPTTTAPVPTTTAPVPTTTAPTPTTTPDPTTAPPAGTMIYGDVNGDGAIRVDDATLIQKHSVGLTSIDDKYLVLADVNADGVINVLDATMIQKYIVGDANWGLTGQPYAPETEPVTTAPAPTEPTTEATEPTVVTEPTTEATEPTTEATEPETTNPPLSKDYYLFGYINGANYGCEEDYENLGDYKFVDGKVTVNFNQTSYVGVKTADNEWFMTDDWQGAVTEVTLYNANLLGETANKLMVPAGESVLTLVENADGTLTLSYELISEPVTTPTEATVVTEPETTNPPLSKDYYLFGFINGANYGCEEDYENLGDYKFVDGKVTVNFSQTSYVGVKTADGDWFMTDDWQGEVTEVTLYNASGLGVTANKLMIPAGESVLTLVENADGTLTLSYELISEPVTTPTEATEATEETVVTEPETTIPPLSKDYYLFGFINGANYGCEEDYENLGDYKFVDGKVTVNFSQTSYVGVKTADGDWFMTDDWQGEVTEVTLYNASGLGVTANKLMIPAGESVLTLVENADGTLTLSYELISEPVTTPTEATEATEETTATEATEATEETVVTEPETTIPPLSKDYYLFGFINGANYGCEEDYENLGDYKFVDGKVTVNFSQTSYVGVKTADGDWFMTDDWQGEVTEVTLYNASGLGVTANKLMIPAGESVLTLVENADGTLTLSYELISEPVTTPTEATEATEETTATEATEATEETVVTEPETTTPAPTKDYYLFGYINGANYGCEEDYENLGDYKFVDGKVTVNFDQTSYVGVKTADGDWFMTDDWQGAVTEVTLYNASGLGETANKLMIPAGESVLTLVENADGTLTLSYELISEPVTTPTEATEATEETTATEATEATEETVVTEPETTTPAPTKDYYLFGYINGANYGCEEDYENLGDYKFVDGKVTVNFDQTSYVGVKTADGDWFMTDDWQGAVTEVTLYNASGLGETANKLMIPAGESVLTLVENADGTLTLSYELISEPVTTPTEATEATEETTATEATEATEETVVTEPETTTPAPTKDYYLFGYINGANYGCEEDYENLGDYKFVDGKVTVNFDQTSYVGVKTADGDWFMTDDWQGEVTEVTLYNASGLGVTANKLMVPAGESVLTLVENADGTLTLSYELISEPVTTPTEATEATEATGATEATTVPGPFTLSRVYFDNSVAKYEEVYIYGWQDSGLGDSAHAMTQIEGTDIWYYDFASPLAVGAKGFLFKSAKPNWEEQTIDLSVVDGMNCYKANAGKKTGGSWSYYTEK